MIIIIRRICVVKLGHFRNMFRALLQQQGIFTTSQGIFATYRAFLQHFVGHFCCIQKIILSANNLVLRWAIFPYVTTRVAFLYGVLLGIVSYTEQNLAIWSRLYGVEYFCYSEKVIGVECFCCSEQIMLSRLFLLLRSSRQEVFCEKGLRSATLLKRRL